MPGTGTILALTIISALGIALFVVARGRRTAQQLLAHAEDNATRFETQARDQDKLLAQSRMQVNSVADLARTLPIVVRELNDEKS